MGGAGLTASAAKISAGAKIQCRAVQEDVCGSFICEDPVLTRCVGSSSARSGGMNSAAASTSS